MAYPYKAKSPAAPKVEKPFVFSKYHTVIDNFIMNREKADFIINAGPGSGKTTTGAKIIAPQFIRKYGMGLAIAFNGKNAKDLQEALSSFGSAVTAGTINSVCGAALNAGRARKYKNDVGVKAGYNAFYRKVMAWAPCKIEKLGEIIVPDGDDKKQMIACIKQTINRMMQAAYGIPGFKEVNPTTAMEMVYDIFGDANYPEDLGNWICETFAKMEADREGISFVEQIYRPLKENIKFPEYKWVLFDEGQDATELYYVLLDRLKAAGAVIAVIGDTRQAINGFMGAMPNALEYLQDKLNATPLPLSISYRCSRAAVNEANKIFPDSVEAHENAKEGEVNHISLTDLNPNDMEVGDAIISRVHKYLLPVALSFIKERKEFSYKGAVDIVSSLKYLIWKAAGKETDCTAIRFRLSEFQDKSEEKLASKSPGAPPPPWMVKQKENIESLIVMLAHVESEGGNGNSLNSYFNKLIDAEKGSGVCLSTFHAAKGAEWPNVFIVGPMESSLAKTEKELAAEKCVAFVAVTRSSDKITFVSV